MIRFVDLFLFFLRFALVSKVRVLRRGYLSVSFLSKYDNWRVREIRRDGGVQAYDDG
jgi:hypothetical protein